MSDIDDIIYAPIADRGYTLVGELIVCKHCGAQWKQKTLLDFGRDPKSSMSCDRQPTDCALIAFAKGKD